MRRRCARSSSSENRDTSTPAMLKEPEVGRRVRFSMRNSVVFPAPLGPMTAACSTGTTVSEIPSTATVPSGKIFRISRSSYTRRLLQEPRRDRRVLDALPVGVDGLDVFLGVMKVEQLAVLGI